MDETENVIIPSGDESTKYFNFNESVTLKASKTYEIRFELVNGYPNGCSINDVSYDGISLGDVSRRRLLSIVNYNSLNLDASPSSCTLSASLAQSDGMKTGVSALCEESDLDTTPAIEAGLFQQHARLSVYLSYILLNDLI